MQYRWCTGKRGSGSAPDRPREDSSSRGLVVLMVVVDLIATVVALLCLYGGWLWFQHCVHLNRLDRRHGYVPSVTGAWARPRRYEELSQ